MQNYNAEAENKLSFLLNVPNSGFSPMTRNLPHSANIDLAILQVNNLNEKKYPTFAGCILACMGWGGC